MGSEESRKSQGDDVELAERGNKNESAFLKRSDKNCGVYVVYPCYLKSIYIFKLLFSSECLPCFFFQPGTVHIGVSKVN